MSRRTDAYWVGLAHRRDAREVLGRGAQQRHAADVDLLQRLVEGGGRLADGLGERVEVDDDEVDLLEALLGQLGQVIGLITAREERGEDLRVEGLDAATEDLGRVGQVADGRTPSMPASVRCARVPSVAKARSGIGQAAGKLDDAFTVTDGEQGAQSTSPVWYWADGVVGPPIIGAASPD